MKLNFKKSFSLLLLVTIFLAPLKVNATPIKSQENLFNTSDFSLQANTINLIVNNLYKVSDNLVLDGYIYNGTKLTLIEIKDFELELYDEKNIPFARVIIDKIDIPEFFYPLHAKRVKFLFNNKSFNLKNINLDNISWKFNYKYKQAP